LPDPGRPQSRNRVGMCGSPERLLVTIRAINKRSRPSFRGCSFEKSALKPALSAAKCGCKRAIATSLPGFARAPAYGTDDSCLAVAGRDLMGRIQVHHILPSGGTMPIKEPVAWRRAGNEPL